jgi:hypothetical protein
MTGRDTQRPRPQWLDEWLNYPHGSLDQKQARELAWYAQRLSDELAEVRKNYAASIEARER